MKVYVYEDDDHEISFFSIPIDPPIIWMGKLIAELDLPVTPVKKMVRKESGVDWTQTLESPGEFLIRPQPGIPADARNIKISYEVEE